MDKAVSNRIEKAKKVMTDSELRSRLKGSIYKLFVRDGENEDESPKYKMESYVIPATAVYNYLLSEKCENLSHLANFTQSAKRLADGCKDEPNHDKMVYFLDGADVKQFLYHNDIPDEVADKMFTKRTAALLTPLCASILISERLDLDTPDIDYTSDKKLEEGSTISIATDDSKSVQAGVSLEVFERTYATLVSETTARIRLEFARENELLKIEIATLKLQITDLKSSYGKTYTKQRLNMPDPGAVVTQS